MLCMIGNIINLREKFYEIKFWNLVYVMKKKIFKLVCMLVINVMLIELVNLIFKVKIFYLFL